MIDIELIKDSGAIEALKQQKFGRIHTLTESLESLRNTPGDYPHFQMLLDDLRDLQVIQSEIIRITKEVDSRREDRQNNKP